MAGNAISIATLASSISSFLYGTLREKISLNGVFALLFLLMGIGYGLISVSPDYTIILISLFIAGTGLGLLMPNLNTWALLTVTQENRGKFSGFLSAFLFLGQFMSPLVVAPLIDRFGIYSAFAVVSVLLIGWGIAFFTINKKIA